MKNATPRNTAKARRTNTRFAAGKRTCPSAISNWAWKRGTIWAMAWRRECQGEGFATEAGEALLAPRPRGRLDYVTATHDVNNPKSGAVMRRLGLTYRYSYKEQWMPKDIPVVFRLYQKNFTRAADWTYPRYREIYPSFVEEL